MFGNKKKSKAGPGKSTTPPAATSTPLKDANFTTGLKFERKETPEERAQKAGTIANTANLALLTVFGAFSGIFLLIISMYLSHLEAMNAALIIGRPSQYAISLGLSLASAVFSIIGFQYLMRWWKYRTMGIFLPGLVEKAWTADEKRQVLYNILVNILKDGKTQCGGLGLFFLALNTICSGVTLWAIMSALPEDADSAVLIYTFAISILAFSSGACISLITNADINEKYIISLTQGKYMDCAEFQGVADVIVTGKK